MVSRALFAFLLLCLPLCGCAHDQSAACAYNEAKDCRRRLANVETTLARVDVKIDAIIARQADRQPQPTLLPIGIERAAAALVSNYADGSVMVSATMKDGTVHIGKVEVVDYRKRGGFRCK